MSVTLRFMMSVAMVCLCGCPLGTPRGHYRPHGHQDTTIAVSPTDDAILFNAIGAGGRDLYLLDLIDMTVARTFFPHICWALSANFPAGRKGRHTPYFLGDNWNQFTI